MARSILPLFAFATHLHFSLAWDYYEARPKLQYPPPRTDELTGVAGYDKISEPCGGAHFDERNPLRYAVFPVGGGPLQVNFSPGGNNGESLDANTTFTGEISIGLWNQDSDGDPDDEWTELDS